MSGFLPIGDTPVQIGFTCTNVQEFFYCTFDFIKIKSMDAGNPLK